MTPPTSAPPSATSLSERAAAVVATHDARVRKLQVQFTGLPAYPLEPSDVLVGSFMKSGTTLTQQIMYQLVALSGRVAADPTGERFDDISDVIPFIDAAPATGIYFPAHKYHPRCLKTHGRAEQFAARPPDVGRFIYCVRDGLTVAASYLDFTLDWVSGYHVEGDDLRREVYSQWMQGFFMGRERREDGMFTDVEGKTTWFSHVRGWADAKQDNILFMVYEHMVNDIPRSIRIIARFMGIPVTNALVEKVAAKCTRDHMAGDPRYNDIAISRIMGIDMDGGVRVRKADAPGFKQVKLPEHVLQRYHEKFWSTFGMKDYQQLVETLTERNRMNRHYGDL